MNTATAIDSMRTLARDLERRETIHGGTLNEARRTLARKAGVSIWTWRNLVRGRLKRPDAWLKDRVQALLVRELQNEITRLEHDLETALRAGELLSSQRVGEIQAYLQAARSLMPAHRSGGPAR